MYLSIYLPTYLITYHISTMYLIIYHLIIYLPYLSFSAGPGPEVPGAGIPAHTGRQVADG